MDPSASPGATGFPDSHLHEDHTSRVLTLSFLCSLSPFFSISLVTMLVPRILTVPVLMDILEEVYLINGHLWRRQAWRVSSIGGAVGARRADHMLMSDSDMRLSDSRLLLLPICPKLPSVIISIL